MLYDHPERENRGNACTSAPRVALVVLGGAAGLATLKGASADVDPSQSRDRRARHDGQVGRRHRQGRADHQSRDQVEGERHHRGAERRRRSASVNAGDVLAELDKEQLAAALRGAEANLQAARASLEGAEAQLKKNIVEAEGPDVEFARRTYERAQTLFGQQPDRAVGARRCAQRGRRGREPQARRAVAAGDQPGARSTEARAQVAQAKAAADRAAEDLANATIRAPIRGTVLTRDVEIGSPVSSILNLGANATLVMTLGDIEQVFVRGKVDEADIGRVRLGQPARIRVETFKDKVFNGKVTQISPMGVEKDNVTNFEVRVSIDNPGQRAQGEHDGERGDRARGAPDALIVPEAAVTYDAQKHAFVEVAAPGTKTGRRKIAVKLGVGNGTKIQVLDGLKQGDKVILPS